MKVFLLETKQNINFHVFILLFDLISICFCFCANDTDVDGEKNARFNELRRVHYDEFRKVKEMRSSGSFYEEEEEDDGAKGSKTVATTSRHTKGVKKEVDAATTA